jgi:hypothetical protein
MKSKKTEKRVAKKPVKQAPKKTKLKELLVSFVLDETGSMETCKSATISGFNEYIQSLKKQKNVKMTLTKFNSKKVEVVYTAKPIVDVPALNDDTYRPDECTPLYDAIGKTIAAVEKEASHGRVLIAVQTDGLENASKEYTQQKIFDKIKEKEALGWTFAYLGAGKDAWIVGMTMGFASGNITKFDPLNPKHSFACLQGATMRYCASSGRKTHSFFKQ